MQKIPLRRDHAQEVKLVRLSLPLDGEGLIIHVKFIEKHYLQRLAGPEGRGFHNVLLHLVHRRIMGLAVKDAHPVAVFNAQDHPWRQRTVPVQLKRELRRHHPVRIQLPPGPLLPQRRQRRQLVRAHLFRPLHGKQRFLYAPPNFQFCLMIKRKIYAKNREEARQEQHADENRGVRQHEPRRYTKRRQLNPE